MDFTQVQRQEQKLALTQDMLHSLDILQMDLLELGAHIGQAALENPLLELEPQEEALPLETRPAVESADVPAYDDENGRSSSDTHVEVKLEGWEHLAPAGQAAGQPLDVPDHGESHGSLADALHEQLLLMPRLEGQLLQLCDYLIQCLDESGYFPFATEEIAEILDISAVQVEQALFVLQSLQPTGVAARNLEECLILQLAQTNNFYAQTIQLVKEGLPLLARQDYSAIARLLGCRPAAAKHYAAVITALTPLPARGYGSSEKTAYQIPEATLALEDGRLVLGMNTGFLPRVYINAETEQLLAESHNPVDRHYLKHRKRDAEQLQRSLRNRQSTLQRLLGAIVTYQQAYFLHGAPLKPLTMGQLAEDLELNTSTVSRALKGKSIQYRQRVIPVKDLLTNAVSTSDGAHISSSSVKAQIRRFVDAEDPAHPLSDEALCTALQAINLPVSRRTVSKYRVALGIPSFGKRKAVRRGGQASNTISPPHK